MLWCCSKAARWARGHGPGGVTRSWDGDQRDPFKEALAQAEPRPCCAPKGQDFAPGSASRWARIVSRAWGLCSCPVLRDEAGTHAGLGPSWRLRKLFPPDLRICICYPHRARPYHPPGQETKPSDARVLLEVAVCGTCSLHGAARSGARCGQGGLVPSSPPPPPLPICPCC